MFFREVTGEGVGPAVKTIQESLARERDPCVRARLLLVWAEILSSDNLEEVREWIPRVHLYTSFTLNRFLQPLTSLLLPLIGSLVKVDTVVNTCCQYLNTLMSSNSHYDWSMSILSSHWSLDSTRPGVQQCQAQGLVFCP